MIAVHLMAGLFITGFSTFLKFYTLGVLGWGVFSVIKSKNKRNTAQYVAAYMCGLELLLKIYRVDLFWEFSKYAVILVILIAAAIEGRLFKNRIFIVFILLLIPSISFSDSAASGLSWREMVASTLSGPIALAVVAIYFKNRIIYLHEFARILFYLLLGHLTTLSHLVQNYMDLEEITFNISSNFAIAGYGPNQVSASLGFAVTLLFISNMFNFSLSNSRIIDLALGGTFLYFAFLTFSRGGVVSALAACLLTFLFIQTQTRSRKKIFRSIFIFVIVLLVGWRIWENANMVTDGNITLRYKFLSKEHKQSRFTGREVILKTDWAIFKDNWLIGIGAGMGRKAREEYSGLINMSAHTEFSRLLAEHGLLGMAALLIMIWVPLKYLKNKDLENKAKCVLFVTYSFLTMSHSATRQVAPSFMYGLALLNIQNSGTWVWWQHEHKKKKKRPANHLHPTN